MAKIENPFIALGLNPGAIEGLSDDEILVLIKALHRAWASLLHPDLQGGNERKFKLMQEAVDKLERKEEFSYWKEIFLRPRKDRIQEAENAKKKAIAAAKMLQRRLVDFWIALSAGRKIFQYERPLLEVNSLLGITGFSVFNPPSVSILAYDELHALATKGTARNDIFELRISEGILTRQNLVQTFFDSRESWRPKVSKELVHFSNTHSKCYYWKPDGEPLVIKGLLLGSLPGDSFKVKKTSEQDPELAGLLPVSYSSPDAEIASKGYTVLQFEPYFSVLSPVVETSRFIVVAEGQDDETLRFKALGRVNKIFPIES